MLQFMASQRVRHDWEPELNWKYTQIETKGEKREKVLRKKHMGNTQLEHINGIPGEESENVKHFLKLKKVIHL